jgi:prolyl-tRNA editing enzyme YbaK/EbsC (Cys-tRNA(Pro) deacylase)
MGLTMRNSADLEAYVLRLGLEAEIVRLTVETRTVEAAAEALRVTPDLIIKSLVFESGGVPIVVVAGGTRPVQRKHLAAHLRIDVSSMRLASPHLVRASTGYPVGAVPPFGYPSPIKTLMDRALFNHEWVYGGGGEIQTLLKVKPEAILRATQAEVVDLQSGEPGAGG